MMTVADIRAARHRDRPMSAMMAFCLAEAIDHDGKLIRHHGGFWSRPGCPKRADDVPQTYFTSLTINGLVARERMEFVEWRESQRGPIPIVVKVKGEARTASAIPDDILMAG